MAHAVATAPQVSGFKFHPWRFKAHAVATAPQVSGFKFHPWRFKAHAIATGFLISQLKLERSDKRLAATSNQQPATKNNLNGKYRVHETK